MYRGGGQGTLKNLAVVCCPISVVNWLSHALDLSHFLFFFLFYRSTCEFTYPPIHASGGRGSCRCRDRERRFVREENSTCVCECTALVIDHGQYCSLLYFVFGLNETVSEQNQLGTGKRTSDHSLTSTRNRFAGNQ